jgi:hypothetical protein
MAHWFRSAEIEFPAALVEVNEMVRRAVPADIEGWV